MSTKKIGSMGWERDIPDFRDYGIGDDSVAAILKKSKSLRAAKKQLSKSVDLRKWCSPIEDQLDIGSCAAHAGVGMIEYFQRRAFGKHLDASRLFLYKVTRKLLGWEGDQGATMRATMKAMALFGVPPEEYWPYETSKYDKEPPSFCYAYAEQFQALKYYRLDSRRGSTSQTLKHVRKVLAAGLPVMFGFSVFSSIPGIGDEDGDIPMPKRGDEFEGGHAVCAVGFDETKKIGKEKGGLLIRNSWSEEWGEGGYGFLPYAFVEDGLAADFWSLVQAEFVDTDLFQ